jgi:peptide/nickel transport system permease protein
MMLFGRKKHSAPEDTKFTFRAYAWKQFKANKPALFSMYLLIFMMLVAVFASFISNDQPLYVKYRGKTFYPAFNRHWIAKSVFGTTGIDSTQNPKTGAWERLQYDLTDWKALESESIVWPLVPYSSTGNDILNSDFAAPGDEHFRRNEKGEVMLSEGKFRHRLGTDMLGRDVLAGLIHGTKVSLLVGIVSMGIAVVIGVFLGALAGYFGDHRLKVSRAEFWMCLPGLFFGYFYGFVARSYTVSDAFASSVLYGFFQLFLSVALLLGITWVFFRMGRLLRFGFLSKSVNVPLDRYISRFIEIFNSMPRLLLIISISAVIEERSLWLVMVIIGMTSWTEIARFVRAELLKVRELDYIQAARSMGFSEGRIIFRHALPNAMAPVFVYIAFGIASAILIESGLSFLNIGVPDEVVTWGSMLNIGRMEPEAWWMIIFPGLAIFVTITVYNLIGEGLRDALDPKNKR